MAMCSVAAGVLAACGSASAPPPAPEPAVSPPLGARPAGRVVPVGNLPEGVAADGPTGLVAVGLRQPAKLVVLDGRSGRVVKRIALRSATRHLSLGAPGGPLLVPEEEAGVLAQVALPSGRVESSTRVGTAPHDATAAGGQIVVANEHSDSASILRGDRVLRTVPAPLQPGGVDAAPDGTVALIAVRGRVLATYDPRSGRMLAQTGAGVGPTHVAYDRRSNRFFVADTEGQAILSFKLRPKPTIVGRLNLPGTPYGIAVDPDRGRLWVTLTARNQLVETFASLEHAPRVVASYPSVRQPNTVAVDPRTGRVFVTGRDDGVLQILDPPR